MTLLTDNQVTEIAEALEALSDELTARNVALELIAGVLSTAAGHLTGTALMRASVPQAAYFQPPYGHGPENAGLTEAPAAPALAITVTGRTHAELEERARQLGKDFFGADAELNVRLTGAAAQARPGTDSDPVYACGASVQRRG